MRVVCVDTYYPEFLESVYSASPTLANLPYHEQHRALMNQAFGVADFHSCNLARLGHEATELVFNCGPLQDAWQTERGRRQSEGVDVDERLERILLEQIRALRPDVLHVQDCITISPALVRRARESARVVTTQVACPIPGDLDLSPYDLVLSSMPHYVDRFRARGLCAMPFRLGFEPTLLDRVAPRERRGAIFVGGLGEGHVRRTRLLELLASEGLIDWWGYGEERLARDSPLRACHRGRAWGLAMYSLLAGCQIALNDHIDVAEDHANNMRLYEATGMGALLLTDAKRDLGEYFEAGREVLTYRDPVECAETIRVMLSAPGKARRIALEGQRRTLAEHGYLERMREFVELVRTLA